MGYKNGSMVFWRAINKVFGRVAWRDSVGDRRKKQKGRFVGKGVIVGCEKEDAYVMKNEGRKTAKGGCYDSKGFGWGLILDRLRLKESNKKDP
jgi:hypothetical protein